MLNMPKSASASPFILRRQKHTDGVCCRVSRYLDGPRPGSACAPFDWSFKRVRRLGAAAELPSLARLRRRSDGPTNQYRNDSRKLQAVGDDRSASQVSNHLPSGIYFSSLHWRRYGPSFTDLARRRNSGGATPGRARSNKIHRPGSALSLLCVGNSVNRK